MGGGHWHQIEQTVLVWSSDEPKLRPGPESESESGQARPGRGEFRPNCAIT